MLAPTTRTPASRDQVVTRPGSFERPLRILVVCVGNLCRSPLAALVLSARLGDGFAVTSAGLLASEGRRMEGNAAAEAVRLGADPSTFTARRLTPEMVREADLVLAATRELRSRVVGIEPAALSRTFTLREMGALAPSDAVTGPDPRSWVRAAAARRTDVADRALDIPDPMGESPAVHRVVADLVEASIAPLAVRLKTFTD